MADKYDFLENFLENKTISEEFAIKIANDINTSFKGILKVPAEIKSDGLLLKFNDGSQLELRYPSKKKYSFNFLREGRLFVIDTAPIHDELETYPNHIHDFDGKLLKDDITDVNNDPIKNIESFLRFFDYIQ